MTIASSASAIEGFDFSQTDESVVATHKLECCEKTYSVKVYYKSDWDPSSSGDELIATMKSVESALGVFKSQLDDDSVITLTRENKLFIRKNDADSQESYDYSFKGCLPADHVEVYVGEIEKKSIVDSMSDSDEGEFLELNYSEKDNLLWESYLENEKKGKAKTLQPHVPINNSEVSEAAQKNLQEKSKCFSHVIAPRENGDCGISAFFCAFVAALAQEKIDNQQLKSILEDLSLWADHCGINNRKSISTALENGLKRMRLISKKPSQAFLRELVENPYDQSCINFVLRQIALMSIAQNSKLLECVVNESGKELQSTSKLQQTLFAEIKIAGSPVHEFVIPILQQVFKISFKLYEYCDGVKDSPVIEKEFSLTGECSKVHGVAIYKEGENYYTLLNQRIFQFV